MKQKAGEGDIKDKVDKKNLTSLRGKKKRNERKSRQKFKKTVRDYEQLYTNKFCNREHGESH